MSHCDRPPRRWVGVSIAGPRSRELLQRLVRDDLSAAAFKLFHVKETAVGLAPIILTRAGFTGELGYELWTTPDYFLTLYEELCEPGLSLGLVHFGGRALSSLRLEKAYGSFNKDFRPDYTAAETGLDRFIDFGKAEFIGRAAALRRAGRRSTTPLRGHGSGRRRCRRRGLRVDHQGQATAVGYVTSGAYGHCIDKSLAAGYVPSQSRARRRGARDRYPGRVASGASQACAAVRSEGSATTA